MGKADLKVTVGLLVLGVGMGWVVLWVSPGGLMVRSEHPANQAVRPSPIPPSQTKEAPGGNTHPRAPLTPAPSFKEDHMLPMEGNIVSISQEKRELTIGTYRVEQNRAVLASQRVIELSDETTFARATYPERGAPTEDSISSQEMAPGDLVMIIPAPQGRGERPLAAKIIRLDLPPPPGG